MLKSCCCNIQEGCDLSAGGQSLTYVLAGRALLAHRGQRDISGEQQGEADEGQEGDQDGGEVEAALFLVGGSAVAVARGPVAGLGGAIAGRGGAV